MKKYNYVKDLGLKKEDALGHYINIVKESWTYEKLTDAEKEKIMEILTSIRTQNALKGDYKQRINVLNAIYGAFLAGLNYRAIGWREEKTEELPF